MQATMEVNVSGELYLNNPLANSYHLYRTSQDQMTKVNLDGGGGGGGGKKNQVATTHTIGNHILRACIERIIDFKQQVKQV